MICLKESCGTGLRSAGAYPSIGGSNVCALCACPNIAIAGRLSLNRVPFSREDAFVATLVAVLAVLTLPFVTAVGAWLVFALEGSDTCIEGHVGTLPSSSCVVFTAAAGLEMVASRGTPLLLDPVFIVEVTAFSVDVSNTRCSAIGRVGFFLVGLTIGFLE